MSIELVLPTNPKVGLEAYFSSVVNKHYIRIYSTDAGGTMDNVGDYAFALTGASADDYSDLQYILGYCGITTNAKTWLAATGKDAAVTAILKWIREVLVPSLVDAINRFCGAGPVTQTPFASAETLFDEVMLHRITFNVTPDGKITASA